jgi:hypothetical protein
MEFIVMKKYFFFYKTTRLIALALPQTLKLIFASELTL